MMGFVIECNAGEQVSLTEFVVGRQWSWRHVVSKVITVEGHPPLPCSTMCHVWYFGHGVVSQFRPE